METDPMIPDNVKSVFAREVDRLRKRQEELVNHYAAGNGNWCDLMTEITRIDDEIAALSSPNE